MISTSKLVLPTCWLVKILNRIGEGRFYFNVPQWSLGHGTALLVWVVWLVYMVFLLYITAPVLYVMFGWDVVELRYLYMPPVNIGVNKTETGYPLALSLWSTANPTRQYY